MFDMLEKYRKFRAYNKYNYPGLFAVLGVGKAGLEFALVICLAWYGLPILAGQFDKQHSSSVAAAFTGEQLEPSTKVAADLTQVEIPAVAAVESEVVLDRLDLATVDLAVRNSTAIKIPQLAIPVVKPGMYNADWLMKQNANSYVVQLASTMDKTALYQKAFKNSDSYPSVIFPFKKTQSDRVMYGYALGMYQSYNDAQESITSLEATAVQEGVWIRQVGELQQKIRAVM